MNKKLLLLGLAILILTIPSVTLAQTGTAPSTTTKATPTATIKNTPANTPRSTDPATIKTSPANTLKDTTLTTTTNTEAGKVKPTTAVTDILSNLRDPKAKLESYKTANETQKLERLKSLGADLIENRLVSLDNLKTRINEMAKTNAATKTATLAEINKSVNALNALNTKIQADTDLVTLKADIKSIYETYRVYMVLLPKNLGLNASARGQYILGQLSAIEVKLQKIITQNKTTGKDMAAIEKLIIDFDAKIADAKSQLQIADTQFESMTPADTEVAKTAREAGKNAMNQAKDSLKAAHDIMKSIIEQIKLASTVTPTPTPVISPSTLVKPSPSITPVKPVLTPTSPSTLVTPSPTTSSVINN